MTQTQADPSRATDLLYPFYLDADMSMAFAAALSGGVALETEQTSRVEDTSKAIRNLRGSLRLFGAGSLGAGSESGTATGRTDESTLVRRHSTHSVFIALYEELRSSGRLVGEPAITDLEVGQLVSMRLQPAIAPLRRVIDQVLRLLDVMAPVMGLDHAEEPAPVSRQERRQRARQAAKAVSDSASRVGEDMQALTAIQTLFIALRDDLEHSGMVDVVVSAEDAPGVVLTLDKRFADRTALELLHTSSFTVVGKVTQIWPTDDDVVLLYRRSALSLVPALSQQVALGVFSFLIAMAKAIGGVDVQEQMQQALGEGDSESMARSEEPAPSEERFRPTHDPKTEEQSSETDEEEDRDPDDDVRIGNDIAALNPALTGPAVQILPLALCI